MSEQSRVNIYRTPLLYLARDVAKGWGMPFRLTPQSFYTSPMSPDNLVLKVDEWRRIDEGDETVGNRTVCYIRTLSAQLKARIAEYVQGRTIQDAIQEFLPEFYADRPDGEFAFFERVDITDRRTARINLALGHVEIEAGGVELTIARDLEGMTKVSTKREDGVVLARDQENRLVKVPEYSIAVTFKPYSAFGAIKAHLLG